ncbi:hypothetical protein N7489_011461 [Penicillium chrysogenum]|uniref:Uncharacterized protein n=1 Tax=Penicillium chrysogenum TaxID=5076 RepID=A0ABQ8W1M0_PENCH|nr:uncharacterized protein N7489_011461 [Penicillium chrysogenum]KAJ5230753.1 hypothetical protein N7489_011461 [Penicillium chrysogenum]KAJ5254628.1 hypothetical protein N7505_011837 [Penicillium chrysogenum]KAJ5268228.1 hypothetical protein N7524_005687 [Penicillium chrysogenum]KAJ6163011.1 hypothetical protein N7497_002990 [Penicillium chrysogenum]
MDIASTSWTGEEAEKGEAEKVYCNHLKSQAAEASMDVLSYSMSSWDGWLQCSEGECGWSTCWVEEGA